jgi:phosphohistidine phosphatase
MLRAVETAELLVPLLREDAETIVTPLLATAPTQALLAEVRGELPAFVGHQPWMGQLLAWLVTGRRGLGPTFPVEKGEMVRLEGEARPGGMRVRRRFSAGGGRPRRGP